MPDITKGYTFSDSKADWASEKETALRLNKMVDEAKVNLVAGTNITINRGSNGITINSSGGGGGSGTVTSIDVDGGAGISVSPAGPITTSGTFTVTNTAPDVPVVLTGAGTTTITGTYPNFTVSSADTYTGTVTGVSVVSANGITGSATATSTPAITLTLGAITPTSVNSITLSGASTPSLSVTGASSISGSHSGTSSGTNTGDQTITLTGDVTGSGTGSFAATIANGAVSNAKLANVATSTFKGRTTAGTGSPEDLTSTQATALLNPFSSTLKGLAPASGGGTTNFLRADGSWAAPAGGGGGGDVFGPSSSVNNNVVFFSGTTGKLIKDSGLSLSGSNTGDQTITLTGAVTGSGTGAFATSIALDVITNANINSVAAIADTKLATISTALKVSNSATTATSANTGLAIVARDASGNFSAGTITANITGNVSGSSGSTTGNAATVTTNANLTGDVTSIGNATTITNGVVANAKLASVATSTFKGRTTAGTGSPEDLTATQATALLNPFSSTLKGLAPASGGGTTNFLRADGTWSTPTLSLSDISSATSKPSASGSVLRSFAEREGDVFNVKDFGAVGDGNTSDDAAVAAALAAAVAASAYGGTLYFPAGRYRITSLKSASFGSNGSNNTCLTIRGEGAGTRIIQTTSNTGVFDLLMNHREARVVLRDFWIQNGSSTSYSSQPAIKVACSINASVDYTFNFLADNVSIAPTNETNTANVQYGGFRTFDIGLDLYNIKGSRISGFMYSGDNNGKGTGIICQKYGLGSDLPGIKCNGFLITQSAFFGAAKGVWYKDSSEGMQMNQCTMVAVACGVCIDYAVHVSVVNCHINANGTAPSGTPPLGCVVGTGAGVADRVDQLVVTSNLLYTERSGNIYGVSGNFWHSVLSNNSFNGGNLSSYPMIHISPSSKKCAIVGNIFFDVVGTGILLDSGSTGCLGSQNVFSGVGTTITDNGSNTVT